MLFDRHGPYGQYVFMIQAVHAKAFVQQHGYLNGARLVRNGLNKYLFVLTVGVRVQAAVNAAKRTFQLNVVHPDPLSLNCQFRNAFVEIFYGRLGLGRGHGGRRRRRF